MIKVFVDGSSGTTGLRINERLSGREDIEMIKLSEEERKDPSAREDALKASDVTFWCLPDDASAESEYMIGGGTIVIDTATVHRCDEKWTYGFAELRSLREKIAGSSMIANPGCHASGFVALIAPLIEEGAIDPEAFFTSCSLTGYSGGGKKMIAEYEAPDRDPLLSAPRLYSLGQAHKHLPEMVKYTGLKKAPGFEPIVCDFYSGMQVSVVLEAQSRKVSPATIKEIYADTYKAGLIKYTDSQDQGGYMSALSMSGRDDMRVSVYGNEERLLLVSSFDNLGKGASGAAIQNMNIALGLEEDLGLITG
ncbi:MAG: N-acetyl-gamma-glutamyl-phosphate reductase [Eubacteriaceae bacterium]|nr:N-acetyl-gamma-glutamyl-phosphate reductase [Eubacteriaceae bacterium]